MVMNKKRPCTHGLTKSIIRLSIHSNIKSAIFLESSLASSSLSANKAFISLIAFVLEMSLRSLVPEGTGAAAGVAACTPPRPPRPPAERGT